MPPASPSGIRTWLDKTQRYLLSTGFLVAAANGVVEQSEVQALASILGHQLSPDEFKRAFSRSVPEVREEVSGLAKDLSAPMTGVQKLQLIRDIVIIAYADGSVDQQEIQCLIWLCEGLGVDPRFIQQILDGVRQGVD